jgi:hypothetical protein
MEYYSLTIYKKFNLFNIVQIKGGNRLQYYSPFIKDTV